MSDMVRRAFVTLLGGAAIWPFATRAEKSDRVRRVGVLMGFAENDEVWQAYLATFRQALQDLGWTDGRNVRFDYRFTGDSEERMRSMAGEVVGLSPDVILVSTNSVVSAALNATRSIPIVFTWVSDPVGSGSPILARSRPGSAVSLSCMFRKSLRTWLSCGWSKPLPLK